MIPDAFSSIVRRSDSVTDYVFAVISVQCLTEQVMLTHVSPIYVIFQLCDSDLEDCCRTSYNGKGKMSLIMIKII